MREVELQIEDVAFGGKGVARDNGKAVFIPFTIEGERVSARITREKKNFAEAELESVHEPSPQRVAPACPYFGGCGGCSYQHISYEHQLATKTRQVDQALRRIGHIADPPLRAMIPSPLPYGYRNRITVHAEDGVVGFFRRDVHRLMDIAHCPIARPEVNEELARLRRQSVRDGHYTLRAAPGPRVFTQANDAVAEVLADLLGGVLASGGKLLIDAYCGAGFFSKRLTSRFEQVVGIDWDRFAIEIAQRNATSKEEYIAGDVETELSRVLEHNRTGETVAIADPPAIGLGNATRRALIDFPPALLLYISCNPPTLARDLQELQAAFTIESVTPIDMFPQTAEIETLVHLRSKSSELGDPLNRRKGTGVSHSGQASSRLSSNHPG